MCATNLSHSIIRPLDRASSHYNLRIKEFPDYLKLTCFSRPIFNPDGVERYDKEKESKVQSEKRTYDTENTRKDSLKRTKDKAMEIAFANDWTYFVTLTLDKSKISRTDPVEVGKKLKTWLNNKAKRIGLKYLVFPEYHKDGESIHFHGLMSGDLSLQDSGKETERGQTIYNTDSWPYGFTTVVKLDENVGAVTSYIMKYITKDSKKIFGNYYFAGGGIRREVPTFYDNTLYMEFQGEEYLLPAAGLAVKFATVPLDENTCVESVDSI